MVEFVQLTTECCWGQPSDPCQRGCLTSHACVMWGPRTLNADDDDDDDCMQFTVFQPFRNLYINRVVKLYTNFNKKQLFEFIQT